MLTDDPKYWLGFSLVPEIGAKRMALLQSAFGDLASAWHAAEQTLREAGLDGQPLANLLARRATLDLDAELARVAAVGAHLLTLLDPAYPPLLSTLPDAPPLLYVRGTITPADNRALAVVGTRRATTYGRDAAYELSRALAGQGVTIISGMAHGIDAAAHRGALEARGRTLAVLGSGIDVVYPPDHRDLAAHIAAHGAVISEFPLGTRPESRNFPRRNRLISGLALGVLVVEAPAASGALITATTAVEQGRDVFAVPGNIFSPSHAGTHRLIQDGAKLVTGAADILEELDLSYVRIETRQTAERVAPADDNEARLLAALSLEPVHVDDLVRQSGLPTPLVSSTLTLLELKGLDRMVGHMQYCLTFQPT